MALPKLSPPPWNQPFNLPNGNPNPGWTQFFDLVYRWMGSGTGTWQGDAAGNAATASTSSGVTFIMNAGTPEGNQQASVGSFYQDTDTNIIYVKSDGDDTIGWDAIT
jgi:hypothetical protein